MAKYLVNRDAEDIEVELKALRDRFEIYLFSPAVKPGPFLEKMSEASRHLYDAMRSFAEARRLDF